MTFKFLLDHNNFYFRFAVLVCIAVIFVVNGESTENTESRNGPCRKEGYVVDRDDPRIYYLCKKSSNGGFEFETFICGGDSVWNEQINECTSGNSTKNYDCLRKNLESDAQRVCYEETLDALEEEVQVFIDAAAYRGNPKRNFHLTVKDIHLTLREHYSTLIQNTGKNIFPLIVATDSDTPELAGVGGAYKVYFRNGTMKRIVPVSSDFELHKCLSHIVLGVFSIVAPYFRASKSINWQPALRNLNQRVAEALFALPTSGLQDKEQKHAKEMLSMVDRYISQVIRDKNANYTQFHKFATELAPLIDKSMQIAAKAHVTATIPALQQLKKEMGETEWRKVYVLIPTVWPVSLYNIRLQMFRKVMDFKQIKQQVLIAEGARTEDDARTTLGRIVADRALAQLVFGGLKDDSMKDHLFSLSTRRDLLSTTEEEAIGKWCGGQDDWTILTRKGGDADARTRCPMAQMASMLRQAA